MKIRNLRKRFLSAAFAASLVIASTSVGPATTNAAGTASANKTLSSLTVDGSLGESVWTLGNTLGATTIGTPNNTVSFGTLWDANYLYVGVKALDSALNNDSAVIFDDDSFDIYIDANHNKGTSYDGSDRMFQVAYNDGALVEKNNNTSGVLHATAAISGGFTAELAIPWSSLGVTPAAGTVIGLDIANNDDDNGGTRDSQKVWSGTADNYTDTSAFGDLTLSAATVGSASPGTASANKTLAAIATDGSLSESVWSIGSLANKTTIGTPNNTLGFGALWDATYLYVGVKALDGNLFNDSSLIYDDDSIDIYIDANHNKGTSYDSFDRQFQVGYNDSALTEKNGNTSGVLHATAAISGGFTAELAIPWSSLGVTPSAGTVIGLDIANNDDDNGSARDSQLIWNGTANDYLDTSVFGDLTLSGTTVGTPSTETVGGGSISSPAIGPAPTGSFSGFTLVKNWHFGTSGTIKNTSDLVGEFQFHDQFGTIANGTNYGAVIVAPTAATALGSTPTGAQPVEDPNHPVRQFTSDSLKTFLVPLNGATSVSPGQHNVGNGSIQAKWNLPNGGSLLGRDILWETRVRYDTPQAFWFALWNAGNQWNQGAEIDLVESFGYDNGGGNTNFDGRYWHSNSVNNPDAINYGSWSSGMAAGGVSAFDPLQYHTWQLLYAHDNSYKMYMDGHLVQSGNNYNWTVGNVPGGTPIDFDFMFDFGWGHTQVASVNKTLPASALSGKYYEINYSRVYLK
ncbi:sugar-binding protein [Paenibacillus glycinis]|uniref:GH16 domain-containing protein n=1 Tax=Paenibacillus glycinis TaxID=2697035 RepID=A0ABW9XKX8_9BACL|nr:sugar-binding protein [Paenibacillus glycinis]NBD23252.1 hypothetical protein [Paenibacillus glycinis]